MKKFVFLFLLSILVGKLSFSQKLLISDLIKIVKGNSSQAEDLLNAKNFDWIENENDTTFVSTTFSYGGSTTNRLYALKHVYTYENLDGNITTVIYDIMDKNEYLTIKNSASKFGFKFIKIITYNLLKKSYYGSAKYVMQCWISTSNNQKGEVTTNYLIFIDEK